MSLVRLRVNGGLVLQGRPRLSRTNLYGIVCLRLPSTRSRAENCASLTRLSSSEIASRGDLRVGNLRPLSPTESSRFRAHLELQPLEDSNSTASITPGDTWHSKDQRFGPYSASPSTGGGLTLPSLLRHLHIGPKERDHRLCPPSSWLAIRPWRFSVVALSRQWSVGLS
jgi:hypothetical protein